MQLAKFEGMDLPSQVDAKHKSAIERLQGMNGTAFDTAYMQSMVQDHEQDVADFQKEAQSGSDPGLKAFAQKYLPVLQQHLQMAQSVIKENLSVPNPQRRRTGIGTARPRQPSPRQERADRA